MRKLIVSLLLGLTATVFVCGQNHVDSARYFYNESSLALDAGDFLRSEILLEKLLDQEYSLSAYQMALVRNRLGYVYYQTGRLEEAIVQYRRSEDIISRTDTSRLQIRISIHINKALYYNALGDYTNSLLFSNEANRLLGLIPEWDEVSYVKLSNLLLNKGITLYLMGEFEEALGILQECEQIKLRHNHTYLGSVYFNLARVYQNLEDFNSAREYYQLSIEQWSSEYDSDFFELANIYLHFGQFLAERGMNEEGLANLQKALNNYRQNYGEEHPLTAACYESLARFSLNGGEWEDALDYLQLALGSIAREFEGEDHFLNPEILSSGHDLTFLQILATKANALEGASSHIGTTKEKTEYLHAALATNLLSIDVLYRIRNSFLSSESRIYLNSNQKDLFTSGIRLNLELFRLTGIETYKEDAFLMAAKGKSGELIFEMNEKEWLYLESLPDTVALIATELKQQNSHLSNLIQIESLGMDPDSARLLYLQNQLFQTQDSFSKQMEQLRLEFPEIGHFESTQTDFTLQQIRRNLKRKEALVEYFVAGSGSSNSEQLYIFVLTKNECHVHQSSLNNAFRQHLQTITHLLHDFVPYDESKERFDSLKLALFGTYQEIVYPLEPYLKGRNLIVVPDEMLSYIPFDALVTHLESESITNYAGISYLLQDYDISYMYNSQLIRHRRSYGWRFPRVTAWIPAQDSDPTNSFGKLRGAIEEVQGILEFAKGRSIQKSLEKQELSGLLQENSILHLAMHSLATENTSKSPYFILDSVKDSLLANRMHDYEINALNLMTPMVVLSSCETAGGQLNGGEGVMSLSRSFLQAGAASVVHSLWPVEDAKSRELMIGFYKEIKKGRSKSSALTQVKKQYLKEQPPFYTHPYYWAAFQITGDISPLHNRRSGVPITGSILFALLLLYGVKRRNFFRRV